ncbi:hypothetical protein [Krasilnikovia sp. M28-CT-15]|uniref:hypothetical protein n=1 Tax=Krasilnikovia sp. M28-CT-15 TaxID=3373540 RepID=UPI00399CF1D2
MPRSYKARSPREKQHLRGDTRPDFHRGQAEPGQELVGSPLPCLLGYIAVQST